MYIKPAPGIQTRDPVTLTLLPEEGMEVSDYDIFWNQRVDQGDVIKVSPPVSAGAQLTNRSAVE
jgi:Protein of unknown function (DUF2635)